MTRYHLTIVMLYGGIIQIIRKLVKKEYMIILLLASIVILTMPVVLINVTAVNKLILRKINIALLVIGIVLVSLAAIKILSKAFYYLNH